MIKTGDVVRAFRLVWPKIDADMVTAARESGILHAVQVNPFTTSGAYDYCPKSLERFLDHKGVAVDLKAEVLRALGINFRQLQLIPDSMMIA